MKQGWYCICHYEDEAPEPEGIVWFDHKPEEREEFLLPSSGFTETWVVKTLRDDMSFTANILSHEQET